MNVATFSLLTTVAYPFFDSESVRIDMDVQIVVYFGLAGKTPSFFELFLSECRFVGFEASLPLREFGPGIACMSPFLRKGKELESHWNVRDTRRVPSSESSF